MSRNILLVAVLGLVIVTVTWFSTKQSSYAEVKTIAEGVRSFDDLQGRFQELAREKGGVYAFEILKRAQLPQNTDLHLLGHAVGDILYEQKEVAAMADCTQDFRNACSHSIVIGALNEFGEGALSLIRDACKKAPGGPGAYTMCFHGLGHGVFAYYGYDFPQMVDFCEKTGTPEYHDREYVECVGGAVMELMGGGGHDREAWLAARAAYLDPTRPLAPCMDPLVPDEAKEQCLTYLTPQLWELAGTHLGRPDPARFPKAFSFCEAIPFSSLELRDACFGGFGKEFLPLVAGRDIRDDVEYSDAQLARVIEWCGLAGVSDGTASCVAEALSSAFWGGEKDPSTAFRLCSAANEAGFGDSCYERLVESIRQYIAPRQRTELCARLPERYAPACSAES